MKNAANAAFLFVVSVVPTVARLRSGRRTGTVLFALILRRLASLRRIFKFHEHDVFSDFNDMFQFDKDYVFSPTKTSSAGDGDPQHFSLRISKCDIANFSESFPVANIDRFFLF